MIHSHQSLGMQPLDDDGYSAFAAAMRARFAEFVNGVQVLFQTDATDLFDRFLAMLPPDRRQHYNCRSCRQFVDRFGSLVTISPDGSTRSVMWYGAEAVAPFFAEASAAVCRSVETARVTGVHKTDLTTWGTPKNAAIAGPHVGVTWHHMHVIPPAVLVLRRNPLKTPGQAAAEKLEECGMLRRGLAEFPLDVCRQALTLLTSGQLFRSEKCEGVARWLVDLHEALAATKNSRAKDNIAWRAVSVAPAGYAHVRTGMIGTLMEDIAASLPFADIKAKFDAKMSPILYQRPQAAPSAGNLAQAEKVVAALASAGALRRRFARIEDLTALWTPRVAAPGAVPAGSVFGHLAPKAATTPQIVAPPTAMTWAKFRDSVLPSAAAIEIVITPGMHNFCALTTAADHAAPPILQWDREEQRNPVAWYVYHGGSSAASWRLPLGVVKVTAVTLRPCMWTSELAHHGKGVVFILDGARDTRNSSLGIFPECLRSEYHGIRASIEAYSRAGKLEGLEEAGACGLAYAGDGASRWDPHVIRVTDERGMRADYRLDRWD